MKKKIYNKVYSVEDSLSIGKSRAFIPSLRNQCPKRYEQYCSYGNGNFMDGYRKIWREYEESLSEFAEIYFYIKETKIMKLGDFYKKSRTCSAFVFNTRLKGAVPKDPFKAIRQFNAACKGLHEQKEEWLNTMDDKSNKEK